MIRSLICAAALVALLAAVPRARAAVVFSQPPEGTEAIPSVLDGPPGLKLQKADDFSLPTSATITRARWWGRYIANNAVPDNFAIRFYPDNGGALPQTNPFDQQAPTNLTRTAQPPDGPFTLFLYTADLSSPVPLSGLTPYHFSVVNDIPVNADPGSGWLWQVDGAGAFGLSSYRIADGDAWSTGDQSSDTNMAFELESAEAVPEPSTIALAALGLAGLGVINWRHRRRSSAHPRSCLT